MTDSPDNSPPWRARAIVRLRQYLGTLPDYNASRSRLDQTWEEATAALGDDPKMLLLLEGLANNPKHMFPRDSRLRFLMRLIADLMLQEILIRTTGSASHLAGGSETRDPPEDDDDLPF